MSRRKQSNPKPIKHEDDGDEMDGGDCRSSVHVYSVCSAEGKTQRPATGWDDIPHSPGQPSGFSYASRASGVANSANQLKPNGKEEEDPQPGSIIVKALESDQQKKDQISENGDKYPMYKNENATLCSSPLFKQSKQNVDCLEGESSICGDGEKTSDSANHGTLPASTVSISNFPQKEDATMSDALLGSKPKGVKRVSSPNRREDSDISLTAKPETKSRLRSASPTENLNNKISHEDDHVISQHSNIKDHVLSECQTPNITNDPKKQVTQKIYGDSKEKLHSKSSFMARFPIIPNGKSFTQFSRPFSQQKLDHFNKNKPSSSSSFSIANITSSAACKDSPENSPHSVSPIGSPQPPSPAASKVDSSRTRSQEEAELALVNQLQLPSDVLYLRQQEVSIHGTPNLGWVVCCAIPLPQGSSLGPFQGQLVAPEDVKVGDLIVQLSNKKGQQALMNVADQSGGWLALLRTPHSPAQRNTHVYWEGGRIWCEIVSDIDMGTELRASFSFQHDEEEEEDVDEEQPTNGMTHTRAGPSTSPGRDIRVQPVHEEVKEEITTTTTSSRSSSNDSNGACGDSDAHTQRSHLQQLPPHPNQQQPAPGHAALIYGCPFCGVRFSSPRTLQGHLSFYCSKKTSDSRLISPTASVLKHKGNNQVRSDDCDIKQEPGERTPVSERVGLKRHANDAERDSGIDMEPAPSAHPPVKISRQYTSRHSLVETPGRYLNLEDHTEKHSSADNHNRMHSNTDNQNRIPSSDNSSSSLPQMQDNNDKTKVPFNASLVRPERHTATILKAPSSETFCKECKIQFSSMRTYKCHKEHYCAQRRKKALADPSPFAAMFNSPFPFPSDTAGASAGLPSALQMSALSQRGLILPGQGSQMTAAAAAAAMILQANMAAMSLPRVLMHQRDSGPEPISRSRPRGPSSTYSLHPSSRDSSPEQQHSQLEPTISKLKPESQTAQMSSVPIKGLTRRSATPAIEGTGESETLNQKVTSQGIHREHQEDAESIDTHKPLSEVRSESRDEDHPLDLSVAKTESIQKDERNSLSPSSHRDPSRELPVHSNRSPSPSIHESSKNTSEVQEDVQKDFIKRSLVPVRVHSPLNMNQSVFLRTGRLSPGSAHTHLLANPGNPSLLLPPPSFLTAPSTTSPSDPGPSMSPLGKRRRPASPSDLAKSISKCLDCNIVFYKHDNYLIHKKHYCSGKRRPAQTSSRSMSPNSPTIYHGQNVTFSPRRIGVASHSPQNYPGVSPTSSGVVKVPSPQAVQKSHSPPRYQSGKIKYKFYCVPCRIKFSNASILEAHKEYYCPAGKDSEHSVILQTNSSLSEESGSNEVTVLSSHEDGEGNQRGSSSPPDSQHEEVTCNRCNSLFSSARLLRLHVCDGGFPCPHCDHVAITENRLAEHLKVHAPTRAYRCTICGYRGNTARGMRMHGKTHIDEGLDFTDENMLEYEEPAVMPILSQAASSALAGGAATDSELLRLKNEPYKRRRSRKAYEKFDHPLPKVDIPQTCPLCGQNFANAEFLASHFKVHQIAASQYLAGLMKCIHCSFVGKSPEDLRAHFEANHASNHRIHFPQRVSPAETTRERQSDLDRRSPGNDKTDIGEIMSPEEMQTHMVITDPNSPLNERNLMKIETACGDDDDMVPPHSTSPFPVKIKEEPMEPEENSNVHNEPVDHFLHIPLYNNVVNTEERESPSLKKLSVSPSVFLPRNDSSERTGIKENNKIELRSETDHNDTSPGISIKKEPCTEVAEAVFPPCNNTPSSVGLAPNDKQGDAYSDFFKSRTSTSASHVQNTVLNHSIDNGSTDNHASIRQEKESGETVSQLSPMPGPIRVQVKQEREEDDSVTSNFLASPNSKSDVIVRRQGISPHSPSRTDQRIRLCPDIQPGVSATGHTASPPSSRHRTSPRQSPPMVTHVPPVHLSSAYPPQPLFPHHSLPFPYSNHPALPIFFLPGQAALSGPRQAFSVTSREDRGSRYCQNCDISFSKQATYLAHKKYYCTARPRGEPQPSATA